MFCGTCTLAQFLAGRLQLGKGLIGSCRSEFQHLANHWQVEAIACFAEGGLRLGMVDFDDWEGVKMHADHLVAAQHLGCMHSIIDAHGIVVADWQHDKIKLIVPAKELHIAHEGGVACKIECALDSIDDESAGVASIAAIAEATAMHSIHKFHDPKIIFALAAVVQGPHVLNALLEQPFRDLVIADAGGACLLCERDGVQDMVAVGVGDQDIVCLDSRELDGTGQGIASDEGVKQECGARNLDGKAGMTVVFELHRAIS
jgi:hypothetical protein